MSDVSNLKKEIKFLTYGIVHEGKKVRAHYSEGSYTKESKIPKGTITIYAKDYSARLPKELNPENDSDMQTDYFEKDRARITPNSPYFNDVLKALKKVKAKDEMFRVRRAKKYGWL